MKNLQHQTNTHLTLVFLHLMGFLLHFLIRSLQLLTQLGLLAALCLCQLGLQAGNDLPGKPPTETRQPFPQDSFCALKRGTASPPPAWSTAKH